MIRSQSRASDTEVAVVNLDIVFSRFSLASDYHSIKNIACVEYKEEMSGNNYD